MRKLVKKYYHGGVYQNGATSMRPLPPDLKSLVPDIDINAMKLSMPQFNLKNPITQKTILGQNFTFNSNNGSKFKQAFNKTNISSTMGVAGGVADALGGMIPKKEQSELTTGLNAGYDAVANAAMAIPGIGTIVGGAMKIGGLISDGLTAAGVGTDQMTTADKILDSKFMKLTPTGLINSIGAKKADTIHKDNEAFAQVGSSYGGTTTTVDEALKKSGKKYGLLSSRARKKADSEIGAAKRQQGVMSDIAGEAKDAFTRSSSMADMNNRRYSLELQGGYDAKNTRVGKSGLKFSSDEQIKRAKNTLEKLEKFTDGGKMNVIPDGALHARLHHMDVDGITKKGIPVITNEDGGEIVQHAEIERDEIIFTKEVTEKLEELYKKGTDEAAIEAGKILAREIIENTIDNTGLMQTVS